MPFTLYSVRWLLRNPFYVGKVRYRGNYYPGMHEAILSQEIFDRVQAQLRGAKGRSKTFSPSYRLYLLKGLARCNGTKDTHVTAIDPETGKEVWLFHPKQQLWFSHFRPTSDGKIRGKDAVGRGTTERLEFNVEVSVIRHRSLGYENGWWP